MFQSAPGATIRRKGRSQPPTLITQNGARLSTDLSRRVVTIVVGMPHFSALWQEEHSRFLAARLWHVLADILTILAIRPPALASRLGYAPWEDAVLAHALSPEDCQELIILSRVAIDADERASFLAMSRGKLVDRCLDPDTAVVTLAKSHVAGWLSEMAREHFTTVQAISQIKLLAIDQLSEKHGRNRERWNWRGDRATAESSRPIA